MMEKLDIEPGESFAIGPIIVEPSQNILKHKGEIFALEPKIMDVLEFLAVNQGKVCSRDDIIDAVWKVEFGADESLTRAISLIRKTFIKARGKAQYIQTISKRGYILQEPIAKVHRNKQVTRTISETTTLAKTKPKNVEVEPANGRAETQKTAVSPVIHAPKKKAKLLAFTLITAVITATAGFTWHTSRSSTSIGGELAVSSYGRSVAVMPFVDLSADRDNQYFSDGIAEELSNELGKIESLRIVGMRHGGPADYSSLTYTKMGDQLKVSHIIHGSVRKQGDRVRITAQLINTEDNSYAWSSNYDGTLSDIFDLQQRVAFDVVTELSLLLSLEFFAPVDLEIFSPSTLIPTSK